jgi:esterase
MSSVLRENSVLRSAVKKLIVVDISLRNSLELENDHLHQLMKRMLEIDNLKLNKRADVIEELKKVEHNTNVINFLLLNLTKTKIDEIFVFGNLQLKYLEDAWKMLKSQWDSIKASTFVPWEGETLFIKGEHSDYIKDFDREEILSFFPNSKIEIVSKSGHWPHFDNKNEFVNKLIKFM